LRRFSVVLVISCLSILIFEYLSSLELCHLSHLSIITSICRSRITSNDIAQESADGQGLLADMLADTASEGFEADFKPYIEDSDDVTEAEVEEQEGEGDVRADEATEVEDSDDVTEEEQEVEEQEGEGDARADEATKVF
jgi:hypothetical protein